MKLKTLKDLFWGENIKSCMCGSCDQGYACDIELIKTEALNWIVNLPHVITKKDWIEFFNLNEDVKE